MKLGKHGMWLVNDDGQRVESFKREPNRNDIRNAERTARRLKFERLCARYGHKPATVRSRMRKAKNRAGMTLREALRTPLGQSKKSAAWQSESEGHYHERN